MNKLTTIAVSAALAASLIAPALATNGNNGNNHEFKDKLSEIKTTFKVAQEKFKEDKNSLLNWRKTRNQANADALLAYRNAVKAADQSFASSTASARATREAAIKAAQDAYKSQTAGAKATRDAAVEAAKKAYLAALAKIASSTPPVVTTTTVNTTTP